MKIIAYRIAFTLLAIALGVVLIYGLTFMGNKTEGPIQDVMEDVSSGVSNMESKYMLETREHTRSESLKWFNAYRNDTGKLRHPDKILTGAFDDSSNESLQSIVTLENSLSTHLPIIQVYTAWGSKEDETFPAQKANAILNLGSLPLITWEPWLSDFNADELPASLANAKTRDQAGLAAIAKGSYDNYIDKWAKEAKKMGKPFMLRMGHEMNDPYRYPWGPQNNQPQDFIAAWQHVVNRFRQNGATNVIWIWAPHPAYDFSAYYPGDAFVDWAGVGALNYGTVATWSQWWSFDDIFGKAYNQLAAHKKPVMITEFGCLKVGGSRSAWFKDALTQLPVKYPAVKSVVFYHNTNDNTTTMKVLDWSFKDDTGATHTIAKAMQNWGGK